ncbi:MAG: hypothetical protein IPH18_00790 [Chitinophagaceae bacterium]|nr:hypothetical protein [Chitinophagaceae bacterium]
MVQVDISQLSAECNTWREQLRHYREEFHHDENKLRKVTWHSLSKDQLKDVEHFHNQFHIQLINIHDLKHAIRTHDLKMAHEKHDNLTVAKDDTVTKHEDLQEQFRTLEKTLLELRNEFNDFLNRAS